MEKKQIPLLLILFVGSSSMQFIWKHWELPKFIKKHWNIKNIDMKNFHD